MHMPRPRNLLERLVKPERLYHWRYRWNDQVRLSDGISLLRIHARHFAWFEWRSRLHQFVLVIER